MRRRQYRCMGCGRWFDNFSEPCRGPDGDRFHKPEPHPPWISGYVESNGKRVAVGRPWSYTPYKQAIPGWPIEKEE